MQLLKITDFARLYQEIGINKDKCIFLHKNLKIK